MRWLRAPLLALLCLGGMGGTGWCADPEVWFNPMTPKDFMNMWTATAPWQNAANHVNVLEIVHWWLDTATDQQILAMTDFAKSHNMKLLMGIQAVERFPGNPCGTTEGYSWPNQLTSEAATLKRLGVQLDMLSMDEPVSFAHYDTENGACQLSIPDLAANVAANLSGIFALYPNVKLYEIETDPGITNEPDWREAESNFQNLLAQAGMPVAGLDLDIGWDTPAWQQGARDMQQFLHQRNMRFGVIEDGSDVARNNGAETASVVQHFEFMEGTLGIIPDYVEFTTWLGYPQYNMPETDPTTQTWEIDRYFRDRPVIAAQFVGQGVQGKLTDAEGQPMVGATINGYVPGVDFSQPLATTVIQEVVPPYAVQGLMGIRLNVECGCYGINDVLVGALQYQETQGGTSSHSYQFPAQPLTRNGAMVDGEWVGGTKVTRFITTAAQSFNTNSPFFPVTPGAQFTFTVPASTIGGEGWFGNVFLLWVNAAGNGVLRINVIPDPGKRLMSTTTTAADGTFQLPYLPRVGPGSSPVTVEFAGDATHRSVAWSPLQ